jgi:hypothetical protein
VINLLVIKKASAEPKVEFVAERPRAGRDPGGV